MWRISYTLQRVSSVIYAIAYVNNKALLNKGFVEVSGVEVNLFYILDLNVGYLFLLFKISMLMCFFGFCKIYHPVYPPLGGLAQSLALDDCISIVRSLSALP